MRGRTQGFTLLETLVAGLILFSALAVMTEVVRTSLGSSVSAEASLALSEAAAALRPQITDALRSADPGQGPQGGEGTYGDVGFAWRAEVIDQGRTLSLGSGEGVSADDQGRPVFLWAVELTVRAGARERRFPFQELSWR